MAKLTGIFATFKALDTLSIDNIAKWFKKTPESFYLENYLANLILYPQVVPTSKDDLEIELAILREALKLTPKFYNQSGQKIIIPSEFASRFTDLSKLIWAFVDAYNPKDIVKIVLDDYGRMQILGSIITPLFKKTGGKIDLIIEGKKYQIKHGELSVIPCRSNRCHINFGSKDATILDKSEATLEAYGGKIGLMIDGRRL